MMSEFPKVLIVGGPDVDARLDLMHTLKDDFEIRAIGTEKSLRQKFNDEGFGYDDYTMGRGVNPVKDLMAFRQLTIIFRKLKPMIVHTFDTKPGVWARMAARLAGVPVVVGTLPGLGSLYAADNVVRKILRSIYQGLQSLASKCSDLTIFQNHDDARQFIETGVVDEQKTKVILGSGVNTKVYSQTQISDESRAKLKNEFGIQDSEIVVTMISRIIRSKGVIEYVEAALNVSNQIPSVRFLLIGAEDVGSIDRLATEELAKLNKAVIWPGARQDIPAILAISDVFVLPSAYREGIPRVLLEAASMGLPIITTDSPGCNEVVENEANGLLIPPRDAEALSQAVNCLVEDQKLRQRFGEKSRQRVEEVFDISVIARQIRSVYYDLLASRSVYEA